MDKNLVKEVSQQFTKTELLEISKELKLDHRSGDLAKDILDDILEDLDDNGIPDETKCSDLMLEFLIAAEYVDEEDADEEVEEIKLPECFGFQDSRDPACAKCRVQDKCIVERTANRPECFGLLFSQSAEECKVCLEAAYCKDSMKVGG